MNRRVFLSAVTGSPLAAPLAAEAQQSDRLRRIGVLMGFAENDEVWQAYLAAFRRRLQELGWTVGRNVRIDYRFTGENTERTRTGRTRTGARELVAIAPDVMGRCLCWRPSRLARIPVNTTLFNRRL
jgi:putative ABC transport system substrate-binding protein